MENAIKIYAPTGPMATGNLDVATLVDAQVALLDAVKEQIQHLNDPSRVGEVSRIDDVLGRVEVNQAATNYYAVDAAQGLQDLRDLGELLSRYAPPGTFFGVKPVGEEVEVGFWKEAT